MSFQQNRILDVYIEANEPSDPEVSADYESRPVKLSIPNVYHPEWAVGALRRVRNVKRIVTVGEYGDGPEVIRYVIKILYDTANIKDDGALNKLAKDVHDAIYASDAHSHHL